MTFGDELAAVLPELREMAEDRMRTTFAIQFQNGYDPDPDTDTDVPVYVTFLETIGRLKSPGNVVHEADVGGRTSAEVSRVLSIPATSPDPWADERSAHGVTALVTAVAPSDDPSMLGARLTLSGPAPGSQTTARRLQVTEVTS